LRLPFGSLISRYVLNILERRVPPRAPLPPSGRLVEALHQEPWRLMPAIVTNALRAIPCIGLSGWKPWFERLLEWWPARVSMTMSAALLAALPVAPLISGAVGGHSPAGVMEAPDGGAAPRFVWLARRGGAYVRHRLFSLAAVAR